MSTSTTSPIGPEVIGRYVVYEAIASGGQASVHYARLSGAEGFGRTVAVKRVKARDDVDGDVALKALIDEARLASRVQHPNVVQTLDMIEHDGELLVVMEYVHGETVGKLLKALGKRREAMPPDIAAAIIAGALRGLAAAHAATDESGARLEIIHRDISPQNIIVDVHGHARVLDFGIAKAHGRAQDTTVTGSIKGKPAYMAPEQLRGKVTVRVDLWATGAVLWELLTGKRLFSGKTDEEVITSVLTETAPAPSRVRAEIPTEVDALVVKALQPDADDRFQTAQEMLEAIERLPIAPPHKVAAWLKELAGDRLEAAARRVRELQSSAIGPGRPRPASPRLAVGLLAAGLVVLLACVFAVVRRVTAKPPPPPFIEAPVAAPEHRQPEPEPHAELPPPPLPEPEPEDKPRRKTRRPPKQSCDPPTYLDAQGLRRYKEGCLK